MSRRGAFVLACQILACQIPAALAEAHSASDAYLSFSADKAADGKTILHGQWDIALRDLDFVLKMDDGDGRLTWGEVRRQRTAIEQYAYRALRVDGGPRGPCTINPKSQMIDDHADGAYAALFFDVVCTGVAPKLKLHYDLFFSIDPSHRGIFVLHSGDNVATALLSPQNSAIDLTLD